MAIDLVDGRAGKPHIDGDDLGDFKAGVCGTAGYVLCTGDVLEATQDDANHVTIGTGAMVMPGSGRHVRVTSPEQVTVTSGTQGQKRRDLIVMRADTGGSVESASLVCVRGTPVSYGTPADPAVEDGDLPLYRVELDGATAAAPVAVFDVLTPMSELRAGMDELRDSVSQAETEIAAISASMEDVPRFIFGSKVLQAEYQYAVLLTADEGRRLAGRTLVGGRDFVAVCNGDIATHDYAVVGYMTTDGAVHLRLLKATSDVIAKSTIRVDYVIIVGP